MAEQKAVCGGFLVGDGLKMEGKVLSAEGGSGGGVRYVEFHTTDFNTFQCELSPEQLYNIVESGENVVLKVEVVDSGIFYLPLQCETEDLKYFGISLMRLEDGISFLYLSIYISTETFTGKMEEANIE